jgi:hypothetical protein
VSTSPATDEAPAADAFICDCEEWARSACKALTFFKEHEGKRYCVLHYPAAEKSAAFNEALRRKLDAQDFDFRGVWFPDKVDFSNLTFPTFVDFTGATFGAAAMFDSATFGAGADFSHATLCMRASFDSATFGAEAKFVTTTFNATASFFYTTFTSTANFFYATFGGRAYFVSDTFKATAYFNSATFKDYAIFSGDVGKSIFGDASSLNLQFARIENPHRVSFHTLTLRPHMFNNVDAREFEFINVDWNWQGIDIRREIVGVGGTDVLSSHRLLAVACRNLAVNAEENHRYEEASRFRYMAMDARRLERWRGLVPWRLSWWYWLASGYGERVWRAFVVLLAVWLVAAALYTQLGFVRWEPRVSNEREAAEARRDEAGAPLRLPRALTYSLGVMTLQKPEPRPATNWAQAVVMLETILGPVQAALLALAIRRKFMR